MQKLKDLTEEEKKRIEAENIEILYRDVVVSAPRDHVLYYMEWFKTEPEKTQTVMAGVRHNLENRHDDMLNGKVSQEDAVNYMQDVAIWHAHEIIQGRANLTPTIQ